MTQVTPPGWYPDPGQTSDAPPTERWWDGKAWTDQTRPVGSAAVWGPPPQPSPAAGVEPSQGQDQDQGQGQGQGPQQEQAQGYGQGFGPAQPYSAYPAYGAYPPYPGQPPADSRRGMRTGIAVGVAVAVLACIGVGVFALTNDGGGSNDSRTGSQQAPGGPEGGQNGGPGGGQGGSGGSGGQTPSPGQSAQPKVKGGGTVSDAINGISLPVPQKWTGQSITYGAQVTSDSTYKCPGDTSKTCTTGGAYSAPAVVLGTKGSTAEEVARADIAANAKESYGTAYGSITSHKVLASEAVTVAGQKGYLVRWRAVTSKGADGIVESLAFPSPSASKQMVVVRFGIDAGQSESVITDITKGIKVSSGSGSGQDV